MRLAIILIAVLLSVINRLTAQTRTVYGRVIGEDGDVVIGSRIQNKDALILGATGMDGRFNIDIPQNTQTLLISYIGYETTTIKLNGNCDTIEVVMMGSATYDFISARKIDRLRLKRFNKLRELHLQAYGKGIFSKESVCYSREFEPDKPVLDSIKKDGIKKEKQNKLTYKKLSVGDTVKIPFSGEYAHYKTGRTTLSYYSSFVNKRSYDCIIKCVIVGKNRHKGGYNVDCKVVSSDMCKYPSVVNGSVMKVGEVFVYNMRYFKILTE